jgi:hypothetical protein
MPLLLLLYTPLSEDRTSMGAYTCQDMLFGSNVRRKPWHAYSHSAPSISKTRCERIEIPGQSCRPHCHAWGTREPHMGVSANEHNFLVVSSLGQARKKHGKSFYRSFVPLLRACSTPLASSVASSQAYSKHELPLDMAGNDAQ